MIARGLAVAGGSLVALVGLELWLGVWIDLDPSAGVAPTLGTLRAASRFDAMWDPTLAVDPVLGWTLAEGRHPAVGDGPSTAATNGTRANRRTGEDERPDARWRVAVFGDSFVFGVGVRDEEAFPAGLARRLGADWQVTNHGVPGYGDDQVAWAMDRWLPVLRPHVVIVGHTGDDAWRNAVEYSYAPKRRSWLDDGRWVWSSGPIASPEALRAAWLARPLVRHLPTLILEAVTFGGDPAHRALASAIVHAQLDRIDAAGAVPVLVDVTILGRPERNDEVVSGVCAARPVRCVDATGAQQRVDAAGEVVFTHQHYSAATNAALAEDLATVVRAAVVP